MSDGMNPDLAKQVGETFSEQLDEQRKFDEQFRQQQEASNAQINEVKAAMMQGFAEKQNANRLQYPPEVIEIANTLVAQPLLLPPTQAFLRQMTEKLRMAINDVLEEYTPQTDTSAATRGT
jgi:hypothetical protein